MNDRSHKRFQEDYVDFRKKRPQVTPPPTETEKDKWHGLALIAFFGIVIAAAGIQQGIQKYKAYRAEEDRQAGLIQETNQILDKTLAVIVKNTDSENRFIRTDFAPPKDAWDRPTQIVYDSTTASETVTILSAGRDGQYNTPDDLKKNHTISGIEVALEHAKEKIVTESKNVKERVESKLWRWTLDFGH